MLNDNQVLFDRAEKYLTENVGSKQSKCKFRWGGEEGVLTSDEVI